MHSSQIILALTLIATAAPAIAAPLPAPVTNSDNTKFARAFTEEAGLQARAPISFGPLGKELLKGLAGGAGLSAVFGGISALTGGNKQRRELGDNLTQEEADQLERELESMMKDNSLQAREPISFGPLGKELLKGLAGGAGLSAVFGGISALTGGNQKRELDERGVGSIIGKLVGATDDALGTVIKNGAIGGAAFGASSSLSGGILNKIFGRELEAREPISFGPLGKELLKGLAGGAGLSAVFGGISALTGGNKQRRELGDNLTQEEADELERELEAVMNGNSLSRRQGVAGAVAKSGLGSLIGKAIVGGLGSAIGGFGVDQIFKSFQGRELGDNLTQEEADELEHQLQALMDADNTLSRRQGVAGAVAKSGLGSLIGKAIVGGLGSAIGGFGVDQIFKSFQGRDIADLTQEEADELERQLSELMASQPASKRELEARVSLGPISKGLIGLGTSLGVSTLVGSGLDKLKGLFQRDFGDNMTQEEADELERQLSELMASQPASKRELEARVSLGPISKGLIGLGTSLGVSTLVGSGLDKLKGLFQRDFGDNMTQEEADELERQLSELMASQPASKRELEARISLGPVSKGLIGLATSLGVSTAVGQGLDAVQGLFQREASLNDLD